MVLLTDIPSELLFTEKLSEFYDPLATKPMHVQIHRDLAKLATAIRKRDALLLQLEISLTKHIKRTARAYQRGGDLPQTRERIWRPVCRWMPAIPFIGHRDDKIDHLEREAGPLFSGKGEMEESCITWLVSSLCASPSLVILINTIRLNE